MLKAKAIRTAKMHIVLAPAGQQTLNVAGIDEDQALYRKSVKINGSIAGIFAPGPAQQVNSLPFDGRDRESLTVRSDLKNAFSRPRNKGAQIRQHWYGRRRPFSAGKGYPLLVSISGRANQSATKNTALSAMVRS